MKKRQTDLDKKLRSNGLGSLMEKLKHPGISGLNGQAEEMLKAEHEGKIIIYR